MIYLDNAATTYPKPEQVYKAMDSANRNLAFNAGRGGYAVARSATALIDETKELLKKLVKAPVGSSVVFTPSITIALNEIIQGVEIHEGDNIYVSPYEHNAVARVCELVAKTKHANIIQMPLIKDTLEIDVELLKYQFSNKHPKLVCSTHVSNVTGYILPVKEIFGEAKKYSSINVLDTAQSLGLIDVDASAIDADFIAFAGHKTLYGPLGIGGFIVVGDALKLNVVLAGGTGSDSLNLSMPSAIPGRYEFASTNIIAVSGLCAALKCLDREKNYSVETALTKETVKLLTNIPGLVLYCPNPDKHIAVISFNVEGYSSEDVGTILDQDYDIAVRTGYHCAPYIHEHLQDANFVGTVRVGIGQYTELEDINRLCGALKDLVE